MEKTKTDNTENKGHYNNEKTNINFIPDKDIHHTFTRKNLDFTKNICFEIPDLITAKESQSLIDQVEDLQFEKIDWEYPGHYRDCLRKLVLSDEFSKVLWERTVDIFKFDDFLFIRPYGIGTEGKWLADSINPCFRFTKYEEGHLFTKHKDGGYVEDNNKRSILTLMIYLNDDFEGGETIFYEAGNEHKLQPKKFTGVIFNHDIDHEGLKLTKGKKYILRTDIMFIRYNYRKDIDYDRYKTDKDYIKAEELYQKSVALQKANDPKGSTETYLRAQEIISTYPTYSNRIIYTKNESLWGKLQLNMKCTNEIMKYIYSDSFSEQSNMLWYIELRTLNREWDKLITLNRTWKVIVENRWNLPEISYQSYPADTRFFELYKMRSYLSTLNDRLLIDIGKRDTRYMYTRSELAQNVRLYSPCLEFIEYKEANLRGGMKQYGGKFESCITIYTGHGWQTGAGSRVVLGHPQTGTRAFFPYSPTYPYHAINKIINALSGGLDDLGETIPSIVSLPYYILEGDDKDKIIKNIIERMLSREYVFLKSMQLDTSVVIIIDGDISTFTYFENNILFPNYSFKLIEEGLQTSSAKGKIIETINLINSNQLRNKNFLIVSDNTLLSDYLKDVITQEIAGPNNIFNCDLDAIYNGFNLILTLKY